MAGGLNKFSYNPEVMSPLGYAGGPKIFEQSESLKRWMKCGVQYSEPVASRLVNIHIFFAEWARTYPVTRKSQ